MYQQNQPIYPNVGQVITQVGQPQVVTVQPQVVAPREWSHDLCGCFDDCGEFIYAYCCTPCYMCSVAARIDESCWTVFCGGTVPMRTKIRTERKIAGSIVGDFCTLLWCPFCAMVQMGKEARDTRPLI